MNFILLLYLALSLACAKTIVFVDNSVSNDTYIASNKERQINLAYKLGLDELKVKCNIKNQKFIGKEPLSIFSQAKEVKLINDVKIMFGLIHSSEALLAAEAFKDSPILALSSGAATDNLHLKNNNFFSLANPISNISKHVSNYFTKEKRKKPIAIIPGNSSYSVELAKSLKTSFEKLNIDMQIKLIDTGRNHEELIVKTLKGKSYDFIYVPGFLQQTLPIFESIAKTGFEGTVYGSANLARSKTDLQLFTSNLNLKNLKIRFPATWLSRENENSIKIENLFLEKYKEEIMGTAVYTYDAVLIAGSYLCESRNKLSREGFINFIKNKVLTGEISTVRRYFSLENGHLTSKVLTVKFNGINQKIESE